MNRRSVIAAIGANKHFVVILGVLVIALTAAAGTPAKRFVTQPGSSRTPVTTPAALALPTLEADGSADGILDAGTPDAPPAQAGNFDLKLPPAEPPPPPKTCSTDVLTELNDQVRTNLVAALGMPVPTESLNTLIQLAAGCSDADPTTAVLDLALEFADTIPDLGLPFIDLPDLPAIPALPAETLRPLLEPLADPIKQGCSQLATVALVLVVAPPAFQIPLSQSDIIQFLAPASSFCAIFDEAGA